MLNIPEKYGYFENDECFHASLESLIQTLSFFKYDLNFRQLIDLTAYKDTTTKLVYILRNISKNQIVQIIVDCSGNVKSATNLFPNAELYECEIYEKFDIIFLNHPNLVRIFS